MATILQLTLNPEPILRRRLAEIPARNAASADIQTLTEDMRVTMVAAQGIGLAANQVGKDFRMFTIDRGLAQQAGISDVFINPVIEGTAKKTAAMEEGCLSIPGKFDEVRRPAEITVSALNERGKSFRVTAKGLLARVLQHEIDHLDGKLFIDRLTK